MHFKVIEKEVEAKMLLQQAEQAPGCSSCSAGWLMLGTIALKP